MAPPPDITAQLAHHDAAITALGGRMTGVETNLRTLQGEVHHGFAGIQQNMSSQIGNLASKLDKLDAAPKFDFSKTVSTVVGVAILFSMTCGGIIYIVRSQSEAVLAEQKAINSEQRSFNGTVSKILDKHEGSLERLNSWVAGTSTQRAAR